VLPRLLAMCSGHVFWACVLGMRSGRSAEGRDGADLADALRERARTSGEKIAAADSFVKAGKMRFTRISFFCRVGRQKIDLRSDQGVP